MAGPGVGAGNYKGDERRVGKNRREEERVSFDNRDTGSRIIRGKKKDKQRNKKGGINWGKKEEVSIVLKEWTKRDEESSTREAGTRRSPVNEWEERHDCQSTEHSS